MMRWWRLVLLVLAGVMAAAAGTVLAVAVNVATGGTARWFPAVQRHPLWWTAGATAAVAAGSLLAWGAQRWYDRGLSVLVPAVQRPEPWVVDRPGEVGQIVAALRRRAGTVGITTAVHGAGGFGKTTVAKVVRADRRVLRRFRGRVHWVTLGRDVGRQALAGLVNDVIGQVEPSRATTFTDARQAGEHLAAVLAAGPRRLLVLDDVWSDEQLAVFPVGGRCARLVTTRIPSLAAGAVPVRVDQMSQAQALALLGAGLPPLAAGLAGALVEETGRWPLLLRLVNKILADQAKLQPDITKASEDLLGRLRRGGALAVDQLTGAVDRQLDVSDPDQRNKAIRTTILASTGLLSAAEHDRFAELAVFAEDETIPVPLITALWQATGGLDPMAARALCARLADLALVTLTPSGDGGTVTVHDVIRAFLREKLGDTQITRLHQVLLDAAATGMPRAAATAPGHGTVTAWWELPESARYLGEHLIEHMLAAGRAAEAEELAADLRWARARLELSGPAGPYADLTLISTPRAQRLARVLGQAAHLLAPTAPPHSLTDILYSRVSHDPDWGAQAQALIARRKLPALINKWPLPDLPHPALQRVLTGHTIGVSAVAIAPDGTWLATASGDRTVRIWDPATGQQLRTLTGHTARGSRVAIAPDGTWLATADAGDTVWTWDPATGQQLRALTGHTGRVGEVAIAPDGTWLATADAGETVRIWDPATGQQLRALTGHTGRVSAVAIAPDGTWLATADAGETVRIWDPATGQLRALTGHTARVSEVAIAPDGTWLATTADYDQTVRIWDPATGQQLRALTGHTDRVSGHTDRVSGHTARVSAVAIAPDGTWLATADADDQTVRIWDPATGQHLRALTGHTARVSAVAIAPDGTWLATAGETVRIWDPATGQHLRALTGHTARVSEVAIAPDGTWLATTADYDQTVRIWDPTVGEPGIIVVTGRINTVAFAPDGTWLATATATADADAERRPDGADLGPGHRPAAARPDRARRRGERGGDRPGRHLARHRRRLRPDGADLGPGHRAAARALTGHAGGVSAVAIAPDGTWLATAEDYDQTVWIWDPATGRQLRALTGHAGGVSTVTIAPDSSWLATAGGYDRRVRIWDPATGRQRAP